MTNPKSSTATTKYYFYNDATQIIYYSEEFTSDPDLIYVGTSDNPNPKMAAGAFMQNGKAPSGYSIQELG